MTGAERKVIESQAYCDLALKLGISATGNEARPDSDATVATALQKAPTQRLQNILDTSTGICIL